MAQQASDRQMATQTLQLAIKTKDPTIIKEAVQAAQIHGALPKGFELPEDFIAGLSKPPPLPDWKPVRGTEGGLYQRTNRETGALEVTEYGSQGPDVSDFLDKAIEISGTRGYEAGKSYVEAMLGKPLTVEQVQRIKPAMDGAPIMDETEGMFRWLMTLEPGQRRPEMKSMSPAIRDDLRIRFGVELALPPIVDSVLARRQQAKADDVKAPLLALSRVEKGLNDKEISGKLGPLGRGWAYFSNPWDTKAQIFKSNISIARQAGGRFLEGGVLRSQFDEDKYRTMFPDVSNTLEVAKGKMENVRFLLKAMGGLFSTAGVPGTDTDADGSEVDVFTLPDLPFNPADPDVAPSDILNWLKENPDYEYAQEVLKVYDARKAIEAYQ